MSRVEEVEDKKEKPVGAGGLKQISMQIYRFQRGVAEPFALGQGRICLHDNAVLAAVVDNGALLQKWVELNLGP